MLEQSLTSMTTCHAASWTVILLTYDNRHISQPQTMIWPVMANQKYQWTPSFNLEKANPRSSPAPLISDSSLRILMNILSVLIANTSCIICFLFIDSFDNRQIYNVDPASFCKIYSKWTFTYTGTSGTSTLRGQIKKWHLLQYMSMAESPRWSIWLKTVKMAIGQGYSFAEIRRQWPSTGLFRISQLVNQVPILPEVIPEPWFLLSHLRSSTTIWSHSQ